MATSLSIFDPDPDYIFLYKSHVSGKTHAGKTLIIIIN
jgi:hypothetical protein